MSESIPGGTDSSLLANRKIITLLIAALLVSIATIGYITATSASINSEMFPFVDSGDMVYVEYVGYYPTDPGGWIFDTNDRAIAMDDSIVKSLYFVKRENTEYKPLNFTAGTATNLLGPFVEGVVGMMVTETRGIYVDVEDAYPLISDYIEFMPLISTAPVLQNLTSNDFNNLYGDEYGDPSVGLVVKHYFWGWNARVIEVSGDKVVLQNEPTVGQKISSFGDPESDSRDGWEQMVLDIDASANGGSGVIEVRNYITAQDAYQKKGVNFNGKRFTLLSVDEDAGVFSIIYNEEGYIGELAGRALYFEVTVTKVLKT